jgi:UDPglucose 6-dehydrogenase
VKLAVVGTGYVGLVTGTCLAEMGNDVVCVDNNPDKVADMQAGKVPIYEPGLDRLFDNNVEEGRLTFTTDLREGVLGAAAIFLALPTPPEEDGSADLSYILGVASELGHILVDYTVVVDKSTVPVGTAEKVRAAIAEHSTTEFDVVSNPEFLREGKAVEDFLKPDRVVIGTSSLRARQVMEEIYEPFLRQGHSILAMDERSAEMTKYAANAFLAAKISFMNEIAKLSEKLDADVDDVRFGIGSDPRIGEAFLYAGIGYGGSCFPKDVQALRHMAGEVDEELAILDAVTTVNERQKQLLPARILTYYEGDIADKTFALWGLAFKPDTDDIREAPALEIIKALTAKGAKVVAFDPQAMDNVRKQFGDLDGLSFAKNRYGALDGADALVIATEWRVFRKVDFKKMKSSLKEPVIFDGRNVYNLKVMRKEGFDYMSIGRTIVRRQAGDND